MALNTNKAKKDNSDNEFDDLDLDLDFNEDEDDDYSDSSDIDLGARKSPKSVKKSNKKPMDSRVKMIIGGACALVVVAVGIVIYVNVNSSKKQEAAQQQLDALQQQQQEQQQLEEANKQKEEATKEDTKAGAPNLQVDTKTQNNTAVTDESKITSDLNGNQVEENYKFKDIKTVRDFINFKKYRAITAEGMEFYWLEVTYKEKPYKVQVPYKIFKELDDSGITVADIEVTTVDKGNGEKGEIVTYMDIVEDSKKLINQNKNN